NTELAFRNATKKVGPDGHIVALEGSAQVSLAEAFNGIRCAPRSRMVTCRRLPKFAGFLLAALGLCELPSAVGSPPHLAVKARHRIAYNGRPSFVGFDTKGTSLVIAGDGGIEAWSWPTKRKLWNADAQPGGRFAFDGEYLAEAAELPALKIRRLDSGHA